LLEPKKKLEPKTANSCCRAHVAGFRRQDNRARVASSLRTYRRKPTTGMTAAHCAHVAMFQLCSDDDGSGKFCRRMVVCTFVETPYDRHLIRFGFSDA
jgi:hypothetical protein